MRRRSLLAVLASLAVLIAVLLAVLPLAVRLIVVSRLAVMTGREVSVDDVDLNLFTRHVAVSNLRVHEPGGRPPLLEFSRLDVRFRLFPIFRARYHVDHVRLADPVVRLGRLPDGRWNVTDVIKRFAGRPAGAPVWFALDRLEVDKGRIVVDDHALAPAVSWAADGLTVDLRNLGTERDGGTALVTLAVAGAPVTITAARVGTAPLQAHVTMTVSDFPLSPLARYLPPNVTIERGRLGTRIDVRYEGGSVHADVHTRIADLAVARAGWSEPVLVAPAVTIGARGFTWKDGTGTIGRIELETAPRFADASVDPPRRFDLGSLRATLAGGSFPAGPRSDLTVAAALPRNGRLDVRGKVRVAPFTGDAIVTLAGVDLDLAAPYIPPTSPVTLGTGVLSVQLATTWHAGGTAGADGDFTIVDLALLRRGQAEPLTRDPRIRGTLTGLRAGRDGVALRRLTLQGAPSVVDATPPTPARYDFASFSVTAEDAAWPSRGPMRVAAESALQGGGTSTLRATLDLATLAARGRATFADLSVLRAQPYMPPDTAVTPIRGRVNATIDFVHDLARGVTLDGTLALLDGALVRRGQQDPFLVDPNLRAQFTGLTIKGGAIALTRAEVTGTPTVVDATASPPLTLEFAALSGTVEALTWPSRGAFKVTARSALRDGGVSTLEGTLDPGTFSARGRATFTDLDVRLARGYIPPAVGVAPSGFASLVVEMSHERASGTAVNADGTLTDLAIPRIGGTEWTARARRVPLTVADFRLHDGAVSVGRVHLTATPSLVDESSGPSRTIELGSIDLTGSGDLWPGRTPARLVLTAALPGSGRLTGRGTFGVAAKTFDATLEVSEGSLGPVAAFLPIQGQVDGTLNASLAINGAADPSLRFTARGQLRAQHVTIASRPSAPAEPPQSALAPTATSPADRGPVALAAIGIVGLDVRWPERASMERIVVERPSVMIEREKDGSFPLRAMLSPRGRAQADAAQPKATGASEPTKTAVEPATTGAEPPKLAVEIRELAITDGDVRFIDRSTTPFYSEEATKLAIVVRGLTNAPDRRATIQVSAAIGGTGALDLAGEMALFGNPFFLDVSGALTRFPLPRTNPYMRRMLDWIARTGQLTTRVHYRVVGDELTATNEIVVERLDVAPASSDPDKLVGLPLGLVVSLIKDARGDIRFTVPVTGSLRSPQWSFGDAIGTALRNVLARLATAPFRAIGSLFTREGKVEAAKVDPLTFEPGSAAVTPAGAAHVQRVADFLRASPYVGLELRPVVTEEDVAALRAQALALAIQQAQGRSGLRTPGEATERLYRRTFPDRPVPKTVEEAQAALRERQPVPEPALRELASRRVAATRQMLTEAAGIEAARLVPGEERITPDASGRGRVEFELRPVE